SCGGTVNQCFNELPRCSPCTLSCARPPAAFSVAAPTYEFRKKCDRQPGVPARSTGKTDLRWSTDNLPSDTNNLPATFPKTFFPQRAPPKKTKKKSTKKMWSWAPPKNHSFQKF